MLTMEGRAVERKRAAQKRINEKKEKKKTSRLSSANCSLFMFNYQHLMFIFN